MEKKSDIWASNPNLTYQEVRKKAGQIWRETLDPEEKAKYIMQSKIALEEYQKKKTAYEASLGPDSPKMPRRPMSAFLLFFKDIKEEIKASNHTGSIHEKASQIWRETLDPDRKAEYIRRYKESMKEYRKEMAAYKDGLDSTAYEASLGPDSPKIPRQPMSAFLLFFKDIKEEIKASNHTGSIHEKASQIWRETLDPDRKAEYIRRYKESMKEYRKEMAAYKDGLDSTR